MMTGYEWAKRYIGLQENINQQLLMECFKKAGLCIDPVTTPWCAAFVNMCEVMAHNKGTGKLNARSFLKYGTEVELSDIKSGDIVVFERGNNGWSGHVAYFVNHSDQEGYIKVLGGNQNDKVTQSLYPTDKILGVRRPPCLS